MPNNEQRSVFNDALADIVDISEELRSEIQRFENPSPPLVLFDGTLSFLLQALDLFNSFSNERRDDCAQLANILRHCGSKCRNALLAAQRTPDIWAGGFPKLTLVLQGYSHAIVCSFITKTRWVGCSLVR